MALTHKQFPDDTSSHLTQHVKEAQDLLSESPRISTGVSGLDEIMEGGFFAHNVYLVRGGPGSGKTTLGLQFLAAGAAQNERCLSINFSEATEFVQRNGKALGFSLDHVHFLDFSPTIEVLTQKESSYDIFSPSDVERTPLLQQIIEQVETLQPQRVFVDAITQLRFLSTDAFQFRKQVIAILRLMQKNGATIICCSEGSVAYPDDDLQFLSDGIINLESSSSLRSISVRKFRGSDFRSGTHELRLTATGILVFPRLLPQDHQRTYQIETVSSGVPELDELLHGGIERGTISIISGPTGVGKTTLGLQFMKEAAGRGERSLVYSFEESQDTLLLRSEAVNIPVRSMLKQGSLSLMQIEPLHFTPDEFASMVRHEVEEHETSIVMLDSVSGYRLSLQGNDLVSHLHALCKYLQNMGVAVLLLSEVETITGNFKATDIGLSYLSDNIIFLRYFESQGEIRRAIGVLKKRLTSFEKTLREFEITRYGLKVGKPLTKLRGVLTGYVATVE